MGTSKVTMPMAWTTGMVAWGMLDFEEGYKQVAPPLLRPHFCACLFSDTSRSVHCGWASIEGPNFQEEGNDD